MVFPSMNCVAIKGPYVWQQVWCVSVYPESRLKIEDRARAGAVIIGRENVFLWNISYERDASP